MKTGAFLIPESLKSKEKDTSSLQKLVFQAYRIYQPNLASLKLESKQEKHQVNLKKSFINIEEEDDDPSNELLFITYYDKYCLKIPVSDNTDLHNNKIGALYSNVPLYVLFQSWKLFLS